MTALKIRRIFLSDHCCNRGQREADIVKASKKVIGQLRKCYSVAPLCYQGKEHFLVAAEKQDPCYLFDMEGNKEETVWEGPGGVMSMVQVPDTDGVFLATISRSEDDGDLWLPESFSPLMTPKKQV